MVSKICHRIEKNSEVSIFPAPPRWDEIECGCGTNEFKLVEEPDNEEFSVVKDVIEPKLHEAVDLIMENATRGCCCDSLDFDPAIEAFNSELAPQINAKIEPLGYVVDAFSWNEWQYNGQTARKVSFLVLRIKEVGTKEA